MFLAIRRSKVVILLLQAEDGIRDVAVTGVQTCALPISVIVTVDIPVAAVLLAVSVKVLIVLVGVVGFVLNDAVTPFGRPDAAKVTFPVKPFWGATVMVLEPLDP